MTSTDGVSNLADLFRGSSHDFCQLYYSIKRDCVSCVLFCSSHAMTSSVIYYSTDARKNEIYLLNILYLIQHGFECCMACETLQFYRSICEVILKIHLI